MNLNPDPLEQHAEKIARKAAPKCGLPVAILIPVICSVLNVAINCWGQIIRNHCRTVDEGIGDFKSAYAQQPGEVQRRLAARVFFSADPPVTAATAKAIAEAMIEHARDDEHRDAVKYFLGQVGTHEQQQ